MSLTSSPEAILLYILLHRDLLMKQILIEDMNRAMKDMNVTIALLANRVLHAKEDKVKAQAQNWRLKSREQRRIQQRLKLREEELNELQKLLDTRQRAWGDTVNRLKGQ
jgi:hypothetical protein